VTHAPKKELLARVDSKQLIITLAQPLIHLPEGFAEGSLDKEGNLLLSYQPSTTSFGEIYARLQAAKLEVRDITTHQADLEDIFRQLVA
jgi:ABC-2 type transport system ATP-binding protein